MAADDAAIADLTKQLVRLSDALARSEERAKKSAEATKEAAAAKKADAAEAAKLSSQLAKLARDITGVEKATEHHGAIVNTLSTALKSLARDGVGAATGALVEWARQIPEGAARAEAHQRALDQLGSAYGAVERATNGAVSAEQAAQVQQRAMQSGLRLSAQELAAVTQRARDYARATGTELGQALDQLTDQLVDPGEELRKFGVFLQTGMNAGDALRETLRQITAQAGQTAPAVQSLAEAQEDFHRATQEASDALSAQVAQELGLRDFYTSLASWIRDTVTQMGALDAVADAVKGTFREMMHEWGIVSESTATMNQSRTGGFMQQAGSLATQLRERGIGLGGVDLAALAMNGSEDQQRTALDLMRRRLGRAGNVRTGALPESLQGGRGFGVGGSAAGLPALVGGSAAGLPALVGGVPSAEVDELAALRSLVGTITERATRDAAMRSSTEGKRRQSEALAREMELGRRNNASSSSSSAGTDNTAERERQALEANWNAARASLHSDERGFALLFSGATRAREEREGAIGRQLGGINLQRQSSDARIGVNGGSDADRVAVIREQREALRELAAEAERAESAARNVGAPTSEVNDLMRQRIGIQQALVQTTQELTEATREQTAWMEPWKDAMEGAGNTLAEGFGQAIIDVIEGTRSFEDAMGAMLRSTVQNIAKQAVVETVKMTATGFGHLAMGNVKLAIPAFKSAGLWAATAVVAGGITAATAPSSSAAASAPARVDGGERTSAARADRDRGAGGPLVLNIAVSGAAFTDAGVHQAVAGALRGAVGSGYLTPTDLRGLLDG